MKPILKLNELLSFYKSPSQAPVKDFKNWFPLFPSEKLAELCGFLIGDGHIQPSPRWRIDFTSNNKVTLGYVNSLFFDLFEVSGKVRKCTTNKYNTCNLGVNCKPLARTLFLCGVPTGAKVKEKFLVPNWILENKLFFRAFVRAYFSSEAVVDSYGKIMLEQWKLKENLSSGKKFMSQIIFGLKKHFGVYCGGPYIIKWQNKTKKGLTQAVRICIRRKNSLGKYVRLVGFVDKVKQSKAERLFGDY
ncbi:MAG: hypothetical protein WC821_02350 [archaeon]|jgi:hypothetical protein